VGWEFAFLIDYSTKKHWDLTTNPTAVTSYSKNLAKYLEASLEVAEILVDKIHAYHHKFINSRLPDPQIYSIGDLVFALQAVKSIRACGLVDKLQFAYTGPWKVVAILDGTSYALEHAKLPNRTDKKHASDLSPYPAKLISFEPMDGPDTRYGQLYKPISSTALNEDGKTYDEASVHGFTPLSPYRTQDVRSSSILLIPERSFRWPKLLYLKDKFDDEFWESDPDSQQWRAAEVMDEIVPTFFIETAPGTPPAAPSNGVPASPSTNLLNAAMILSEDRLFFVSIPIGTNDV